MDRYRFPPRPQPALPFAGTGDLFPVARIFCIGRNYADHAAEMGGTVDRSAPFHFTKSAHALIASGSVLPYPAGTSDLHHEVELVAAIGADLFRATPDTALGAVCGLAVGLDLTRRDLQAAAKDKRRPWDAAKDFAGSAVVGALGPPAAIGPQRMTLEVNGALRQDTGLSAMVHDLGAILAYLSALEPLWPGDLVMTGTPAGVAAIGPGDVLTGRIDGLPPVHLTIGPPL